MHRTTIMLPDDLKDQALRYAHESGLSLGEVIRKSLAEWLPKKRKGSQRNPLIDDVPLYDGPVPPDYSVNHDRYLYGDQSEFS
ncbi:MAG: hypothetical protein JXB10_11180 [Pirellulales bacterium]|nr:hypothetical protein [Pirellulales bacterium]